MSTLLDTSLLTRSAQPNHPLHRPAVDAVAALRRQGEQLCLVPQNFYEFWVVATRPADQNGLGLTPAQVQAEIALLQTLFTVLNDTPALFPAWKQFVVTHQVRGKEAHDARLVAAMIVHGIDRLLTFNTTDFRRYPGITVVAPHDLLSPPATP